MILFLVLGFLLLSLNVMLVFIIRSSRTFAIYPGWIYTLIFLSLSVYLLFMLPLYSPTAIVPKPIQPKGFEGVPNPKADQRYLDKYSKQEKMYLQAENERGNKIKEDLDVINIFLNYLALQSVFAAIAAIVGSRVVKAKAVYYYGFAGLHAFLTFAAIMAKYLINKEMG